MFDSRLWKTSENRVYDIFTKTKEEHDIYFNTRLFKLKTRRETECISDILLFPFYLRSVFTTVRQLEDMSDLF